MVIIVNNLKVYVNARILATIKKESYILYYLLLYLPDFNSIKLI